MLAEGSLGWVAGSTVLAAGTLLAVAWGALPWPALVMAAPLAFVLAFFRDPDRRPGPGVVSPADGRVTAVRRTDDGTTIQVFMSPFDVHVNRAPLDGRVVAREHHPGSHVPAFDKDADGNERLAWTLETDLGDVRVVQIAGAAARRILPYVEEGDAVRRGQRIGIIRLGSRVDLHLPAGTRPTVAEGDRVRAAETTVAEVG